MQAKKYLVLVALFYIGLSACDRKNNTNNDKPFNYNYIHHLISNDISGTNFRMSLPKNYKIKENRGPDFSVYYFYPADTMDYHSLRGGFYLGNSPSTFNDNNTGCKITVRSAFILGKRADCQISQCKGYYKIQIIGENKMNHGWDRMIHAFGRVTKQQDIYKLLDIYYTLRSK